MSILLEALKKKQSQQQEATDRLAAPVPTEPASTESLKDVAQTLNIQAPEGFSDWKLSSSKPNSADTTAAEPAVQEATGNIADLVSQQVDAEAATKTLGFNLVLPKIAAKTEEEPSAQPSIVESPKTDETLDTQQIERPKPSLFVEKAIVDEPLNTLTNQEVGQDEITPLETLVAEDVVATTVGNDVATERDKIQALASNIAVAEKVLEQRIDHADNQEVERVAARHHDALSFTETVEPIAVLDKTPQSAKKFLGFARKKSKETDLASVATVETGQVDTRIYKPTKAFARKSLLIGGGALVTLAALGFVSLSIWEYQQEEQAKQLARFKSVNLTNFSTEPKVYLDQLAQTESIAGNGTKVGEVSFVSDMINSLPKVPEPIEREAFSDEISTQQAIIIDEVVEQIDQMVSLNNRDQSPKVNVLTAEQDINSGGIAQQGNESASQPTAFADDDIPVLDTTQSKKKASITHTAKSQSTASRPIKENQGVSFTRTQSTAQVLEAAYDAWQAGDIQFAETSYRQLLEKQPRQKDALLGMLAVSQVNGSHPSVAQGYADQLYHLYPQNKDVLLAINRFLPNQSQEVMTESMLLESAQQPNQDQGEVNYQLGLVYAEQQRWAEAQASFFNAVSANPAQADYRLNLAISYDHLGKHAMALEHYETAMSLLQQHGVLTGEPAVLQRIALLREMVY